MAELFQNALGTQRPDLADALYEFSPAGLGLVADAIAPPMDVGEKNGQFEVVTRESLTQIPAAVRKSDGTYANIDVYLDKLDYACVEYGLEHVIQYGNRTTVQYDREAGAMNHLAIQLGLAREKRVLDAFLNASTWTGATLYTDTAVTWATIATADPVADVIAARKRVRDNSGVEANAVIMSALNFDYLLLNTKIRAELQYTKTPNATEIMGALPMLFGVDRIIVAKAVYNSAAEGKTAVMSNLASNSYVQVAKLGTGGSPTDPAVMLSPNFAEDSTVPYVSESYWSDAKRGMVYRLRHNVDELVVDKYFAHMLKVD